MRKCFFCQNETRKKLLKQLSYEKHVRKMLMKFTEVVHFTYILRQAFCMKVMFEAFMCLQFVVNFFCQKEIGKRC